MARLLEKIINKKLLGYLTKHNLIFEHQSGFLTGHSTETQLCYLIHRWQMALDKNQMVHAAFLDLSKAYDRVSIPALLHKLSCVGLSKNTLSWFTVTAFLQSRKQCVQKLMDKNPLGRLQNLVSPRVPFLAQHSSSFISTTFLPVLIMTFQYLPQTIQLYIQSDYQLTRVRQL